MTGDKSSRGCVHHGVERSLQKPTTAAVLGADAVTADDGFPNVDEVRLLRWRDLAEG